MPRIERLNREGLVVAFNYLRKQGLRVKVAKRQYKNQAWQSRTELLVSSRFLCRILVPKEIKSYQKTLYLRGKIPTGSTLVHYDFFIIVAHVENEEFGYREVFCIPSDSFAKVAHTTHYSISLLPGNHDRAAILNWDQYAGKRGMNKLKAADFAKERIHIERRSLAHG